MRELQHEDQGLFRTELQVRGARSLAWCVARGLLAASCLMIATPLAAQEDTFRAAVAELPQASFPDKQAIVARILASGQPGVRPVLTAMLEERLYFRTADAAVLIAATAGAPTLELL